jgi:hypothetical protein
MRTSLPFLPLKKYTKKAPFRGYAGLSTLRSQETPAQITRLPSTFYRLTTRALCELLLLTIF